MSASSPPEELADSADGFILKPFAAAAVTSLLKEQSTQASEPACGMIDKPVISAETLARLRALMPESAVQEIYRTLVSDLERHMPALDAAVAGGRAAEVSRIGHAIKGSCGMAGAMEASRAGALLEASAKDTAHPQENDKSGNGASLLRELRTAVQNLKAVLEGEMTA